jgi:hypothetical protein
VAILVVLAASTAAWTRASAQGLARGLGGQSSPSALLVTPEEHEALLSNHRGRSRGLLQNTKVAPPVSCTDNQKKMALILRWGKQAQFAG